MASRTPRRGASRTASCSTAKEWLAAPPAPLGSPSLKPTHHNHICRRRRRASLASTTRRPQHRSSSRFALRALRVDPAPRPTLLQEPPAILEERSDQPVDGPAPFRNGTTDRFDGATKGHLKADTRRLSLDASRGHVAYWVLSEACPRRALTVRASGLSCVADQFQESRFVTLRCTVTQLSWVGAGLRAGKSTRPSV
jgi:hypothetical protein